MTGRPCALITGASSGIGAAFARLLGGQGYDLVLTARRKERLESLAAEIGACHNVSVEILDADLSMLEGITAVEERIAKLSNLQLLINNAGFGTNRFLADSSISDETAMIHVHVLASMRLSRAALPGMIARSSGAIINVASVSAFLPTPGSATYAASKAYLVTFSRALHEEMKGHGVRVQALCPGFTTTEFHDTPGYVDKFDRDRIPGFLWMTSQEVALRSMKALKRNCRILIPGLGNQIMVIVWRLTPRALLAWMKSLAIKRASRT